MELSVHLAAQNVGGLEEEVFELGEGDFFSAQNFPLGLDMFLFLAVPSGYIFYPNGNNKTY